MKRLVLRKGLVMILAVLIMMIAGGNAFAAIPQTVSYQGYLTDAAGIPIDGSRSMVFALYSTANGGTPLWTETQSAVTVDNGIYQVTLGNVVSLSLPFDNPYWLGVTVGEDTEMTPRLALSSAPYALRALTTGDAAGNLAVSSNLALPATTATSGIITSGGNTLMHSYGYSNVFAGIQAGNLTMTGGYNTALGVNALHSNTTGDGNVASGTSALLNNTAGGENVAIGVYALLNNTTASLNTAIGNWALYGQSFGNGGAKWNSYNTAVGYSALHDNNPTSTTNGVNNTALGAYALQYNTIGYANTATGLYALRNNTNGYSNTANGVNALAQNVSGYYNTAIGSAALNSNTTANKNTALGSAALQLQAFNNSNALWDSNNTAIGYLSLYSNQPTSTSNGINNTALGSSALQANTIGYENTAGGYNALRSNTTASRNTAVGTEALYTQAFSNGSTAWNSRNTALGYHALYSNQPTSSVNGYQNTAVGANALQSNTTGSFNTATGTEALSQNSDGFGNTANGSSALLYNGKGSDNTAIGIGVLYNNTTSSGNTAVGSRALSQQYFSNSSTEWNSNNTAIGYEALYNNGPTSINNGINNTALGANALRGNIIGLNNTAVGASADVTQSNLTNATAIGYNAKVGQSNSLVLGGTGSDAVKVGIGTTTPTETLDVVGNVRLNDKNIYLRAGTDANHGMGWYGSGKQFALTDIDGPVLYGWSGGALGTTNGGQKILMQWWDTGDFDLYGYTRFHVLSGGSTSVCRDANNTLSICTSDERLKKDIVSLPETMDVLDALSRLRGVTFTWDKSNPKAANMLDGRDLGMIAQEVEQVFPEVVHTEKDGYKSLDYPKLVAFLVEVNKAQQAELDTMQKKNMEETDRLSSQVKNIQKELEKLKRLVHQQR